jgi:hypothetical protein
MGRRLKKPKFEVGEIAIFSSWWRKEYCEVLEVEKVYKRVDDEGHFYHDTTCARIKNYLKNNNRWKYEGQYILIFTDNEIIKMKHHNYSYKVKAVNEPYTNTITTLLQEQLTKKVVYEAKLVAERLMRCK